MSLGIIKDFRAEDGRAWKMWDFSLPLFEHFFIIGPTNFHDQIEPVCLYEYPNKGEANKFALEKFCFIDGLHFKNIKLRNSHSMSGKFSETPESIEEYIFINHEAGTPWYHYCIRFHACPLDRPALPDPNDEMNDDIRYFRSVGVFPSCLFAYCLVSRHPFHELLFQILRMILKCEARVRMSSANLHGLASKQPYLTDSLMKEYIWPSNVVQHREQLLESIYNTHLPAFGAHLTVSLNDDLEPPFDWQMPAPGEIGLQMALWGYAPLMEWISVEDFLDLITCILLEHSIVVTGTDIQKVGKTVVFLPQLIAPFCWLSPIVTLVPRDRLGLLEAPMSTISGVYKKFLPPDTGDCVVVDLDLKEVLFGRYNRKFVIPNKQELVKLLEPIWGLETSPKKITSILNLVAFHLELQIRDQMSKSTMTKIDMDGEATGFAGQLFKSRYREESRRFIEEFMKTQIFQGHKEQICLNMTKRKRRDSI